MYLPALPAIAGDFHASIAVIEHSLASYFLGVCLRARRWSALSPTALAGRCPILIGLLLYILALDRPAPWRAGPISSISRVLSKHGRLRRHGSGARLCARSFSAAEAARIFAQMLMILSVSPLFAPFVGGWLLAAHRLAQPVLAAGRGGSR